MCTERALTSKYFVSEKCSDRRPNVHGVTGIFTVVKNNMHEEN
jgi:hypothetical protein